MIAEVDALNATFSSLDVNAQFSCEVGICGAVDPRQIAREMKRIAWRSLMDRLGVRQLMSMARKAEFDEAMRTPGMNSWRGWIDHRDVDKIDKLPDISRDSILGVISGTAASAGEYLRENVVEVYKKLKPWRSDSLKTNQKNRWQLSDKVILSFTCSRSGRGVWNLVYNDHGRLVEIWRTSSGCSTGKVFAIRTSLKSKSECMRVRPGRPSISHSSATATRISI